MNEELKAYLALHTERNVDTSTAKLSKLELRLLLWRDLQVLIFLRS